VKTPIGDTAASAVEQVMIQTKTASSAPIWMRLQVESVLDIAAHALRTQAASILRLLILVLVALLFVLMALVVVTGRVEIGGPIIGGVLFIGFSAAQFGR
jgi:hypothetical protein